MSKLSFYPKLNHNILTKSQYRSSEYEVSYYDATLKEQRYLKFKDYDDSNIIIDDSNSNWTADLHELRLQKTIRIRYPKVFFGEKGIVGIHSKIAIVAMCKSPSSSQKSIINITNFDFFSDALEVDVDIVLEKNQFRGTVKIDILMLLHSCDTKHSESNRLANIPGMLLGTLESTNVVLDGDGSQFPVQIIEDDSRPLWELSLNFFTQEDIFANTVLLILNKSHSDFKYIDSESKFFSEPFLKEIMANVASIFILKAVNEKIYDSIDGSSQIPGTVGQVLAYYKDIYSPLETHSTEAIFASVNSGVRK